MTNALFDSYADIGEMARDDEFIVVDASETPGDGVANIPAYALMRQEGGSNLIMNYPSIEKSDGTNPKWWIPSGSTVTVTEEDADGEGLVSSPHERVIKVVTTATGGYVAQLQAISDGDIKIGREIRYGCWVYKVPSGVAENISLFVWDNTNAEAVGVDNSTVEGEWVWLEAGGVVSAGATELRLTFRVKAATSGVTFYVAKPQMSLGYRLPTWKPRGLRYVQRTSALVSSGFDPGGANTTIDWSASLPRNVAVMNLVVHYVNTTSAARSVYIQPYNITTESDLYLVGYNSTTVGIYAVFRTTIPTEHGSRFNVSTDAPVGDVETVFVSLDSYWVWED